MIFLAPPLKIQSIDVTGYVTESGCVLGSYELSIMSCHISSLLLGAASREGQRVRGSPTVVEGSFLERDTGIFIFNIFCPPTLPFWEP